jgi:hypothetical protein
MADLDIEGGLYGMNIGNQQCMHAIILQSE